MLYDIIIHIGSDQLNDRAGLHGALLHYAELSDAVARHKYVQSVVSRGSRYDFLGKPYQLAKPSQLSASRPAPQPSAAPLSDRSARNLMMKRLAITCRATVKWDDDRGFLQYKAGRWVAVPAHLVRYVTEMTAA